MNFIFKDDKTKTTLPIAFIDCEGDLWFRTNDAKDIEDNAVNIITKRGVINSDLTMYHFIDTVNGIASDVKPVKTFYEGDTVTIKF